MHIGSICIIISYRCTHRVWPLLQATLLLYCCFLYRTHHTRRKVNAFIPVIVDLWIEWTIGRLVGSVLGGKIPNGKVFWRRVSPAWRTWREIKCFDSTRANSKLATFVKIKSSTANYFYGLPQHYIFTLSLSCQRKKATWSSLWTSCTFISWNRHPPFTTCTISSPRHFCKESLERDFYAPDFGVGTYMHAKIGKMMMVYESRSLDAG